MKFEQLKESIDFKEIYENQRILEFDVFLSLLGPSLIWKLGHHKISGLHTNWGFQGLYCTYGMFATGAGAYVLSAVGPVIKCAVQILVDMVHYDDCLSTKYPQFFFFLWTYFCYRCIHLSSVCSVKDCGEQMLGGMVLYVLSTSHHRLKCFLSQHTSLLALVCSTDHMNIWWHHLDR